MRNSLSIINWPLRASIAPAEPATIRARHPQTPYQPHNGYKLEYRNRKRLIYTAVGSAFALFSLVASVTLYILVGVEEKKGTWILRLWVVISAGLMALLGLLGVSFYCNRKKSKRLDASERSAELRALGRREIEQERPSNTRAPLVQQHGSGVPVLQHNDTTENDQQPHGSAVTVLHRPDTDEIRRSSPGAVSQVTCWPARQAVHSGASPMDKSLPGFPSPGKLRDESSPDGHATYYPSPPAGSPDTIASNRSRDAQIARRDSLKKLREATLRRKQALESLK